MFWLIPLIFMSLGENATGWEELFNGNIVTAPFVMFDTAFAGWTIVILFLVYQIISYLKTRTLTTSWIVGAIFASMYVGSTVLSASNNPVLKPFAVQFIFAILVIELGLIMYYWVFK